MVAQSVMIWRPCTPRYFFLFWVMSKKNLAKFLNMVISPKKISFFQNYGFDRTSGAWFLTLQLIRWKRKKGIPCHMRFLPIWGKSIHGPTPLGEHKKSSAFYWPYLALFESWPQSLEDAGLCGLTACQTVFVNIYFREPIFNISFINPTKSCAEARFEAIIRRLYCLI